MSSTTQTAIRIDLSPPPGEESDVDAIMRPFAEMLGKAPTGLRMLGTSPALLENYASTIHYYMSHTSISQPLLTFIRYLVSWRGDCHYCIDMNEAFLMNAGLDLDSIRATREDPARAPLGEREKYLLMLAVDAVDLPESVTRHRIDGARAHGWSDRDIFDAVWHANSNRAFGRTAEAFGLPPDGFAS